MGLVRRLTTAEAGPELLGRIRHLLGAAFGGGFSDDDWEHTCGGWHVVALDGDGDHVVSHAAAVPRLLHVAGRPFHTGYVEGVATAPARQGGGLGSLVMAGIGEVVGSRFEMGALSTGLPDFYGRLGWERWRGPTFVRRSFQLVRTEEEDDGVMVLRVGPSRHVDLTSPLSCDERSGDDW